MSKKTVLSFIGVVALIALGAAYFYYYPATSGTDAPAPKTAPDNSVSAGSVSAISATSLTIVKQNGAPVTFTIGAGTSVVSAGQTGTPKKVSDITKGSMVLVTPSSSDATVAQTIVLPPAPPMR